MKQNFSDLKKSVNKIKLLRHYMGKQFQNNIGKEANNDIPDIKF